MADDRWTSSKGSRLFSNSGVECQALRDAPVGFTVLSAVGSLAVCMTAVVVRRIRSGDKLQYLASTVFKDWVKVRLIGAGDIAGFVRLKDLARNES